MKFFNPIISGYPNHIEIKGERVEIETGFRVWLQISRALNDGDLSDSEKLNTLYSLSKCPRKYMSKEANEALLDFLAADPKCTGKRSKKLFSWDYDSERIIASFEMQYKIDLTSPETRLHWWRFMALFRGLGDDTPIMKVISLRATPLPSGNDENSKKRRQALIESQRAYQLPPENEKEHLARLKEIWDM